jgi:hypothetical protein
MAHPLPPTRPERLVQVRYVKYAYDAQYAKKEKKR